MIECPTVHTTEVASILRNALEQQPNTVVGLLFQDMITQDEDGRWRVLFQATVKGQKLIIRVDEPYRGEEY